MVIPRIRNYLLLLPVALALVLLAQVAFWAPQALAHRMLY